MERKRYLFNYYFVCGLAILFLNDHALKYEFGNWFTGKLSDFAGVFILPFLLAYLFPRKHLPNIIFTALFFAWWKSPLSQYTIDSFNSLNLFDIGRVIDYTDLIALTVLPFSFRILQNIDAGRLTPVKIKVSAAFILVPALIVLTATTVIRPYGNGNLLLRGAYHTVKMSPDSIISFLHTNGIEAYRDSSNQSDFRHDTYSENFFKIDELVIREDTLRDVQFILTPQKKGKTLINVTSVNMPPGVDVVKIQPYVRKILKRHLRQMF